MSRFTPLLGAAALVALSSAAFAQDYSFKFQSSDPSGNPNFVLQQQWDRDGQGQDRRPDHD